jgi:hypothetical protein
LIEKEDIVKIGEWLSGAESYLIQQFVPHTTIDPAYLEKKPYGREELEELVEAARPYFKDARLEGPA